MLCCDLRVARSTLTRSAGTGNDDPEGDPCEEWEMYDAASLSAAGGLVAVLVAGAEWCADIRYESCEEVRSMGR